MEASRMSVSIEAARRTYISPHPRFQDVILRFDGNIAFRREFMVSLVDAAVKKALRVCYSHFL